MIRSTNPSVAMIELDEERLNRMRQVPRIQEMTQEQVQQAPRDLPGDHQGAYHWDPPWIPFHGSMA